jgi:hypothetical protein
LKPNAVIRQKKKKKEKITFFLFSLSFIFFSWLAFLFPSFLSFTLFSFLPLFVHVFFLFVSVPSVCSFVSHAPVFVLWAIFFEIFIKKMGFIKIRLILNRHEPIPNSLEAVLV